MKHPTIYIIIPVFNKIALTARCITSLLGQTYQNYRIVVIDDGSTDGTSERISKEFPQVTLLKGNGDLWWTGATNEGVKRALEEADKDDFILTLNNDLEVDRDYLESLVNCYNKYRPCLVGSVSVYNTDPEKIDFLGKTWDRYQAKTRTLSAKEMSYSELTEKFEILDTDLITGRGTLIPIEAVNKIGLFDKEHFPQYIADYDYGIRAQKKGYRLIISTKARVKSVVENTGLNYELRKITYRQFYESLFSIKSPIWLKARYYWAIKHSPIKHLYFIIDVARIFVSYHFSLLNVKRR